MKRTKDIADAIRSELKADPELAAEIEQHAFNAEVAALVLSAREEAGLTQQALADLIGTRQSVIARLEAWDYEGHSLSMLKRIGDALGKRLHVEFRNRFTAPQEAASVESSCLSSIQWDNLLQWHPTIHNSGSSETTQDPYSLAG